ncbi:MAG TPA: amidase [Acidimicrobiia bacterium]|nr:amidase [Acidimicrobiia bacterium]
MGDDLAWLDATAQAELVRTGAVTPAELVDAARSRIETLNPRLNAVIFDRFDRVGAEIEALAPAGPFRGVPFLIKDAVAHTGGDPYHCGLRVAREAGWVEPADTWLVERFRAAGFVIVGKTNTPELATMSTTEPLAYGPTRNPWDLDRSTGGSSGGAAAAVASGMVAVAHGNDMGGSIRIPAGMCGLVGLKPSRARSTLGPDFGEYWAMTTHEHVLTRSVRDTAAVLDAIAGPGVGDPYTAPRPDRPFRAEVGAVPATLRIGVRTALTGGRDSSPDAVAGVELAARTLEALGHQVDPALVEGLDDPGFGEAIAVMFPVFVARELDRWGEKLGRVVAPDELEPWNAMLAEAGRATRAATYVAAYERAQGWARRVAAWWDAGNDVLVTPTVPAPTPPIGHLGPAVDPGELLGRVSGYTAFSMPFNVTGQPAISLPLHHGADGLPVGVQLVAAYGREDLLLRVAAQLEAACPWADRRPPVAAPG